MVSCLDCQISLEREMLLLSKGSKSVSAGRGISWRSAAQSYWGYCMTEFISSRPEGSFLSGNFDLLCELDPEWHPAQTRQRPFHQKGDLRRYLSTFLAMVNARKGTFIWAAIFWEHNLNFRWLNLLQQNLSMYSWVCQDHYLQDAAGPKMWDTTGRGSRLLSEGFAWSWCNQF